MRHLVTKVLRVDLSYTEILLRENSRLKVVHLFRDPRSVIRSHVRTKWFPELLHTDQARTLEEDIEVTCKRIRYDIQSASVLLKQYPHRVKVIQYEDITVKPVEKINTLYSFLGMEQSEIFNNFIQNTVDENTDAGDISNRDKLPWNVVKKIDEICEDVIVQLGYKIYPSENEYNSGVFSPVEKYLPFALKLDEMQFAKVRSRAVLEVAVKN